MNNLTKITSAVLLIFLTQGCYKIDEVQNLQKEAERIQKSQEELNRRLEDAKDSIKDLQNPDGKPKPIIKVPVPDKTGKNLSKEAKDKIEKIIDDELGEAGEKPVNNR